MTGSPPTPPRACVPLCRELGPRPGAEGPREGAMIIMMSRFEDLWRSAADDGASHPLVPVACRNEEELDEILDAWSRERGHSIEYEMLLGQSRKLIARLLRSGVTSTSDRRRARRLMRSIDQTMQPPEGDVG